MSTERTNPPAPPAPAVVPAERDEAFDNAFPAKDEEFNRLFPDADKELRTIDF